MSHFKDVLNKLNESKDVRLDEKEDKNGFSGVVIGKQNIKIPNRSDADKVRKVINEYKKQNASAGEKLLLRLAALAIRMKNATVKEVINCFELSTTDAYKDVLA